MIGDAPPFTRLKLFNMAERGTHVTSERVEILDDASFRLTFADPELMLDKVKGEPVYLILAITPDNLIRMKPQNLVTGLPIRHLETVT